MCATSAAATRAEDALMMASLSSLPADVFDELLRARERVSIVLVALIFAAAVPPLLVPCALWLTWALWHTARLVRRHQPLAEALRWLKALSAAEREAWGERDPRIWALWRFATARRIYAGALVTTLALSASVAALAWWAFADA